MTREIVVKITTDHDDTVLAVQSVIGNLARAGYVTSSSAVHSETEPIRMYEHIERHATVRASEIDLHMEQTREEARNDNDQDEDRAVGSHGLGEEAQGHEAEGLSES